MNITQPISIAIHCESESLFQWLKYTLALTKLSQVDVFNIRSIEELEEKRYSLVIVTASLFKSLYSQMEHIRDPSPVLLLTQDFSILNLPKKSYLTIDTIPIPSITINLLEHSILSLMKDYTLTTKLKKLALHDHLTGAANRLLFEDRLNESLKRLKRHKEPFSIIAFDLDGFKPINDNYGHATGDLLLKRFVKLITSSYRDTDTFARLGGDEFALILPNVCAKELEISCKKILEVLSKAQRINVINIEIQCSIGGVSVTYEQLAKTHKRELLKRADDAIYLAKKVSGTSYIIN